MCHVGSLLGFSIYTKNIHFVKDQPRHKFAFKTFSGFK